MISSCDEAMNYNLSRRHFLLGVSGALLAGPSLATLALSPIRVASFNVHYIRLARADGAWSRGDWEERKQSVSLTVKALDADIIGFQEMESFSRSNRNGPINLTLDWLLARYPDYTAGAIGDPKVFPSTQPIFYRHDRFDLLDQGWFFFSETPERIYSRTFNGSYPAFACWVKLREIKSGKELRVMNVHFDHGSGSNRTLSARLVASRIAPWIEAQEAVFVIGDFNAGFGGTPIETLQEAGLEFSPVTGSTYHFRRGINLFWAIDHLSHSAQIKAAGQPLVLREKFDGQWPSDHYPVVSDFLF